MAGLMSYWCAALHLSQVAIGQTSLLLTGSSGHIYRSCGYMLCIYTDSSKLTMQQNHIGYAIGAKPQPLHTNLTEQHVG